MCQGCELSVNIEDVIFLDCSDCQSIKSLPADLPNLKFLAIYNTNISDVPAYPSLEALYCFSTPIATLPALPKLRKLIAHDTNISELRDDYYRLEYANLNNTNITDIPTSLISLSSLSADNTQLDSISKKLVSLEWLSVANTNIKTIPRMMSLTYLDCSGTKITRINEKECSSLRKLVCRGCPIDPFAFKSGINVSL